MAYCDRYSASRIGMCSSGRKSGQERQGHHAGGGARAGGSAQPVAAVIGGPRDKLFTVITVEARARPAHRRRTCQACGRTGFRRKEIGDLVAAEGRATAETLAKNGCPVRTIHIDRLDEESLGELMMHFMLETIIAAHLLGIDPFDQPAVEEGKVLAKKYLTS